MKYLQLIILFTLLSSCCKESFEEKFKRECPYTFRYGLSHLLMIPVKIIPNHIKYKVGDTITIDASFSNMVYDFSTEQSFLVKNFPFDVGVKLWMFTDTTSFKNGFRVNEYIMDTSFFQGVGGDYTDVIYLDHVETDSAYNFNMKIVLNKKGKYIFQLEDFIRRYPEYFYNERIRPITFEGKCPTIGIVPVAMIQGDDHLSDFVPELLYIDKKVFRDHYTTLYKKNYETRFGTGTSKWEFTSTYGFEVE